MERKIPKSRSTSPEEADIKQKEPEEAISRVLCAVQSPAAGHFSTRRVSAQVQRP